MHLFTAFKVFFAVLFNKEKAERVLPVLETPKTLPVLEKEKPKSVAVAVKKTGPSEAILLLAALQREARLIDFLKENLDQYDDTQVGAAARLVHDQSAVVLERFFDVKPLRSEPEQSPIEIVEPDAAFVQLTGKLEGKPPHRGQLVHHGWKATKCELPQWNGNENAIFVLAPAEIEIES